MSIKTFIAAAKERFIRYCENDMTLEDKIGTLKKTAIGVGVVAALALVAKAISSGSDDVNVDLAGSDDVDVDLDEDENKLVISETTDEK